MKKSRSRRIWSQSKKSAAVAYAASEFMKWQKAKEFGRLLREGLLIILSQQSP